MLIGTNGRGAPHVSLCLLALLSMAVGAAAQGEVSGRLDYPANYREWVFLSSGLDMTYAAGPAPKTHRFTNVFVNPDAYRRFLTDGRWPDGTTLVLEIRAGQSAGSINLAGQYQANKVLGLEVHYRDSKRFPGGWAFFDFQQPQPAEALPRRAECYSCHEQHGAVDTTFVQFYPTLQSIARERGTWREPR